MENFYYYNPVEIYFGKNIEENFSKAMNQVYCKKILLIYGGKYVKTLGIYELITKYCSLNNIILYENNEVVPNPKIELVRKLIELVKKENIDFILSVGGGSSMDTAKTVAIGRYYENDVWDLFVKDVCPNKALPIGVITTIPSSGSESSNCAIISNGNYKKGIETNLILPKFAIMNPFYSMSLPSYQTSCGVMDILSHLLERYFTNSSHVDITDNLLVGAIKTLLKNAKEVIDNPESYDARAEIMWTATLAHNNLLDTGRIACWGCHRIEHELSAEYGITHGEGMGIVFIAWSKYMQEKNPNKISELYKYLFNKNGTCEDFAKKLENICNTLNLKTRLSQLNINSDKFEEMAMRATNNNTSEVGHYYKLNKNDIINILEIAK